MQKFAFLLFLFLAFYPATSARSNESTAPALTQDFKSGLGDWTASGPGSIDKSPLGDPFFKMTSPAGQDATLVSPTYNVGDNRVLRLQFHYRTTVEGSGPDHGSWVLVSFLNRQGIQIARESVICPPATDWTPVDTKLTIPETTAFVAMQFRLQQTGGEVDWSNIVIGMAPAEKVPDAKAGWKLLDTFTLDPANHALQSASEIIQPGGAPLHTYQLPDRDLASADLAYEIEMTVKPGWGTSHDFQTFFALGDNIGPPQPNSMVVTILNGTTLLTRLNSSVGVSADASKTDVSGSPDAIIHARVWFSPRKLRLFFDEKEAGSGDLATAPFIWDKGRPFFLGSNGNGQLLNGDILSFTLRVYTPVLKADFTGGLNAGYYEKNTTQTWAITFPDGDGKQVDDTAEIQDLAGHRVANLKPQAVSARQHDFQLPSLPFGWYLFRAHLTGKDGTIEKERPFTMARPVMRVAADASPFGITTEFPLQPGQFDPNLVRSVFQRCASGGIRWFRLWLRWDDVEAQKGVYDWRSLDQIVTLAQQNGLTLYVCITGGEAPFQAGSENVGRSGQDGLMTPACFMPADLEAWKKFLGTMGARYKGKLTYYQIWNEPDAKNGFYPFDPKQYLAVVKASSEVLRAADPNVRIGLGGFVAMMGEGLRRPSFSPTDSAWADTSFFSLNPSPYFDIVDGHFYSIGELGQSWDRNLAEVRDTRKFLTEQGVGDKPLWNSETSMYSGPVGQRGGWANVPFISEEDQAICLVTFEVQSLAAGVQRSFWYGFRGAIGIVNEDFSPKPAYPALTNVVRLLQGAHYVGEENYGNDLRFYRFQRGSEELTVTWTTTGSMPLALGGAGATGLRIVDMMGNEKASTSSFLEVTKNPVFLLSRAHLEMAPLAVLDFPLQAEGGPVAGAVILRNPSTQPTHFIVAAGLTGGVVTTQQIDMSPGAHQRVPISLTGTGNAVQVDIRATGGVQHDLSLSQALEFQRQAILQGTQPTEITIDQPAQVVIGAATYDPQARLLSAARWKGPDDLSAQVKLWRDGNKVHFEAQVKDDVVLPAPAAAQVYEGDAVEFFVNAADKSFQVVVAADGRSYFYRGGQATSGFEVKVEKTSDGYRESGSFNLPANSFGFDMAFDDADDSGGRKVQMTWSGNIPDFGHPEKFGLLSAQP